MQGGQKGRNGDRQMDGGIEDQRIKAEVWGPGLMAWYGPGLMTATSITKTAVAKKYSHVVFHWTASLLSDGNSGAN